MAIKFSPDALSMLEANWLKKQVESHLLFGFFARNVPCALICVAASAVAAAYVFFASGGHWFQFMDSIEYLLFMLVGLLLLRLPKYHQAAIGWCSVKMSLFFICMGFIIAGGLVGFFRGSPDAMHLTFVGLIWLPGLEFIPRFVEKQRFITIGRLLISVPVFILWQRTGTWHWS